MSILYGKHTQGWKTTYEFASEKDKKKQVDEKIRLLEDFLVSSPEKYRKALNKASSPASLDRIFRAIISDAL